MIITSISSQILQVLISVLLLLILSAAPSRLTSVTGSIYLCLESFVASATKADLAGVNPGNCGDKSSAEDVVHIRPEEFYSG